jgi:O-succinylbenzoate synthase
MVGHARLGQLLDTPICLDETLRSARHARQIVALEGPMVWNIKVHRVGGLAEVCRIYGIAGQCGAALWAGTMPETGIGSLAPLAVAALPGCVYPSDLEPSARWYGAGEDLIELRMSAEGQMSVPDRSTRHLLEVSHFQTAAKSLASFS